jgi:hypothetical protein
MQGGILVASQNILASYWRRGYHIFLPLDMSIIHVFQIKTEKYINSRYRCSMR